MSISLKDGKDSRTLYSAISRKPIIQVRFKHEHRYLIYQEIPQNILDADLSLVDRALMELKKLCQRKGYCIYDFNDMQAQLLAHAESLPQNGKTYVVNVNMKDMITGDTKQHEFAMIGDPTATGDGPFGIVE